MKMKILKYSLLALIAAFVLAVSAFAQENDQEKKIPKVNPPVVIVNSEKKNDGKSNDKNPENKRAKKPQTFLVE